MWKAVSLLKRRHARQKETAMTTASRTEISGSSLVLHAGAHLVSESEVEASYTPPPKGDHYPIPHRYLLDCVRNTLADLGWENPESAHALLGDGMRYFGLLAIKPSGSVVSKFVNDPTFGLVVGLRNAHDCSFSGQGMLATRVFVCDNLAFSGRSESVFRFNRKHTRFIERDLPGVVSNAFGSLVQAATNEAERIDRYRNFALPDHSLVHDFLIRALDRRAITPQMLPHVLKEWRREDGPGGLAPNCAEVDPAFGKPTAWRLLNAVTEVEKLRPSPMASPTRNTRLIGLMDGLVGITSTADEAVEAELV
jgi:hypothetical protein